jgi:predicted RNase H-like HicB family nuclease
LYNTPDKEFPEMCSCKTREKLMKNLKEVCQALILEKAELPLSSLRKSEKVNTPS